MQLEHKLADNFIGYLKEHGYPENSIAIEYKIGDKYRVDVAILDLKNNIPIQLFEIKNQKTSNSIKMGTVQLKSYLSQLKNKNVPAYLVFPSSDSPYFEVVRINEIENQTNEEIKQSDILLNYKAQRVSRLAEEANIIKSEKATAIDTFKIVCWIMAGLLFIIGLLSKFKIIDLNATDVTLLGVVIALTLIPFASKLKILGVEFERLLTEDKEKSY